MQEINRVRIPYDDITIGEGFNSRKTIRNLEELALSIDQLGLLTPIIVTEGGPSKTTGKRKAFLLAGERRYRAVGLLRDPAWAPKDSDGKPIQRQTSPASWNQIQATFYKGPAEDKIVVNLIENMQRENLDPLEEAEAIRIYMDKTGASQAQAAVKLSKSEAYVSQRLSLLKASPVLKEALNAGTVSATQAREMIALPEEAQKKLVQSIETKQATLLAGKKVSVAEVKEIADQAKHDLGIKVEKKPRKDAKAAAYDTEKVKLAKEVYDGLDISVLSATAIFCLLYTSPSPRD